MYGHRDIDIEIGECEVEAQAAWEEKKAVSSNLNKHDNTVF